MLVVIKIGSNVLTGGDTFLDVARVTTLVSQVGTLKAQGHDVVLVSSGAVASGRSIVNMDSVQDIVSRRQVLASVGQVKLISTYADLFGSNGLTCAQVLVTKEDFRDKRHYANMENCLQTLLGNKIIPIINENDVISVTELMFTDNDELAGLLAGMVDVEVVETACGAVALELRARRWGFAPSLCDATVSGTALDFCVRRIAMAGASCHGVRKSPRPTTLRERSRYKAESHRRWETGSPQQSPGGTRDRVPINTRPTRPPRTALLQSCRNVCGRSLVRPGLQITLALLCPCDMKPMS